MPLHKKDSHDIMSNYRPISILPKMSKIIEKCLKSRLLHYFTRNNLINPAQFGFLAEKSTQDAMLCVTEQVYKILMINYPHWLYLLTSLSALILLIVQC